MMTTSDVRVPDAPSQMQARKASRARVARREYSLIGSHLGIGKEGEERERMW